MDCRTAMSEVTETAAKPASERVSDQIAAASTGLVPFLRRDKTRFGRYRATARRSGIDVLW